MKLILLPEFGCMRPKLVYCVKRMSLAAPSPFEGQNLDPAGVKKTVSSDSVIEKRTRKVWAESAY